MAHTRKHKLESEITKSLDDNAELAQKIKDAKAKSKKNKANNLLLRDRIQRKRRDKEELRRALQRHKDRLDSKA